MSGDLKWNKIFGAGLGTVFAILVVQQVSGAIFRTEAPEKMGYFVDAPETPAGGAAAVELAPDWGTVLPVADIAAGEAAFARCQACHDIAAGGPNKIGPNLNGVVGRAVASHAGFAYSDAMKAHVSVDPTWTLDALDHFITAPQRYVAGTKMSFAGLRDTQTRVNLIAYLRSQGSAGFPVPAPDPARQPPVAGAADATAAPADGVAAPTDGVADTAAVQVAPAAH
ncbi:cytochrome c family protein [uncultured Brevundimonas sp.]|uniref:c-type cytochrome n=1 Tax=uncultured Brevundimonas sp. TaxID=213418 RepID=UPI0030EEF4DC|tara:strand:+ start:2636 stop:3310 length:675 start_codon:yes stop_codon:yes gene_type:complete